MAREGNDRRRDGRNERPRGGAQPRWTYNRRTTENFNAQMSRSASRYDLAFTVKTFRPSDGENVVRILPATWPGNDHYSYRVYVHSFVGANNSTYLCPKLHGESDDCPICNIAMEAKRRGDEEEAKKHRAMVKWVCYILDRNSSESTKPLLWMMSDQQDKEILGLQRDRATDAVLVVEDVNEGYDLTFRRTKIGPDPKMTRYGMFVFDRNPSPVHDDPRTQEAVEDEINRNPIPDLLKFYPNEYLDKMMLGTLASDDDNGDDDDEAPRRRSRDEPEEEDERPRRSVRDEEEDDRPRHSKKNGEPEDDDELDDDDTGDDTVDDDLDDDEPELAAKKKKKAEPEPQPRRKREEPVARRRFQD
jgi:gp32 DNA binding protein like